MRTADKRAAALDGIRALLAYLEEDPDRAGLKETPERVLRAWEQDWGTGYVAKEANALIKLFPLTDVHAEPNISQMILVRDLSFYSMCEHHLAPFFGVAHIAYFPTKDGVLGLSKMARVLDYFARRLQVQERLTDQIADFLVTHLSPHVAVTLSATHLCMVSRGVRQPNAKTVTTAIRGLFLSDRRAQAEFLRKTET